LAGKTSLFDDDPSLTSAAEAALSHYDYTKTEKQQKTSWKRASEFVPVDINTASTSFNRSLGPELVANEFFKRIGFDEVLRSLGIEPQKRSLIKAQVIGRLIAPGSDLFTHRWIKNKSALPELLEVDISGVGKDQIYEIADLLIAKKEQIEAKLNKAQLRLFSKPELLLFDLTNTYLEGEGKDNALAKYGHSKEKRSDCLLVTLALVVDERGLPVYSEILEGNQYEPRALSDVLDTLDGQGGLFSSTRPSVVMDRGIATRANLDLLRERNYPYIVVERVSDTAQFLDEFAQKAETFEKVDDGEDREVFVKALNCDEGTKVLCFSKPRAKRDAEINKARQLRFTDAFTRLNARIQKGQLKNETKVATQLGKLATRYPSAFKNYEVIWSFDSSTTPRKVTSLELKAKDSLETKETLYGCYVITSTHTEISGPEIWHLYTTLTKVEGAFRSLKSDLGLRPVFHHGTKRTKAHLFISVLSYHLLSAIEHSLRLVGDNRSWSTINETLSTHMRSTLILTDDKDQIHHLRVSSVPEPEHKEIYDALGVKDKLPRHHRVVGRL
jgi:transposase